MLRARVVVRAFPYFNRDGGVVREARAGCSVAPMTGAQFEAVMALFESVSRGGVLEHCGPEVRLTRPFVLPEAEFMALRKMPGVRAVRSYKVPAGLGGGVRYVVAGFAFGEEPVTEDR